MRDPVRLSEKSESELESALLGAGSSYRGSTRARAKTLAALGLAGAATAAAGTATAASLGSLTKLTKMTWLKVVATVAVVGTAAVPVGYFVASRRFAPPTVVVDRSTSSATVPPRVPPEATGPASDPMSMSRRARPWEAMPARRARPDSRRSDARLAIGSATLAQEVVALDAVRTKLTRGDAGGALSLLDTYGRAYPHGDLAIEAEVLRIDALARSGRDDVAKRRAAEFLRRHPNSVLAARVRAYTHN